MGYTYRRVVAAGAVTLAAALAAAAPAAASAPAAPVGVTKTTVTVPKFTTTAQYKALKTYVTQLAGKVATPVTDQQRQAYSDQLTTYKVKANAKVTELYNKEIDVAKADKAKALKQIPKLKNRRAKAVADLKEARSAKLRQAAADNKAQIANINRSYNRQAANVTKEIAALKKQIKKTKDAVKKAALEQQLADAQDQLDNINSGRRKALNGQQREYAARINTIKDNYANKIEKTKGSYNRQITKVRSDATRAYQDQKATAVANRAVNRETVTDLYNTGTGYINQMPPA